jgi:hypothetical protein
MTTAPAAAAATKPAVAQYETSDIYFAAFLYALGYSLSGTKKFEEKGKEKTRFVFDMPAEDVQVRKSAFFGGTGQVVALQYSNAFRSLKSLCFVS